MAEIDSSDLSKRNFSEKSQLRKYGPILVFILALILLILHSVSPSSVTVDLWTLTLLIFLALVPFISDIQEFVLTPDEGLRIVKTTQELKNQVESSKQDAIEKLRDRIAELEKEETEVETEIDSKIDQIRFQIEKIAQDQGPELAFIQLMQILERELRETLQEDAIPRTEIAGFGNLIKLAEDYDALDRTTLINLKDIHPLRNKVAHAREVDSDEVEQMIELSLDLLETLFYERETSDITENAICNAIFQNPELVESEFEPIESRIRTEYGEIDVLGKDHNGNKVIVEIKSHDVDENNLKQLIGLVEKQKRKYGDNLRGILVSPTANPRLKELEDDSVTVREIDLKTLQNSTQKYENNH